MTITDEHDELMAKLKEFDAISCPRCDESVFTDNEEAMEALTFLGLPNLICPCCLLEYDLNAFVIGESYD